MSKPYKYHLRPSYGSDELLLEFLLDATDAEFFNDILNTLDDINPKVDSALDLWMNNEFLLQVSSNKGNFLLSKDTWGFAFIVAEKNQSCVEIIDQILNENSMFEKVGVDYENYKN